MTFPHFFRLFCLSTLQKGELEKKSGCQTMRTLPPKKLCLRHRKKPTFVGRKTDAIFESLTGATFSATPLTERQNKLKVFLKSFYFFPFKRLTSSEGYSIIVIQTFVRIYAERCGLFEGVMPPRLAWLPARIASPLCGDPEGAYGFRTRRCQ